MEEEQTDFLDPIVARANAYGKTSLELIKLKTIDTSATLLSDLLTNALLGKLLFLFIVFASIGSALWMGERINSAYCGFLSVAACYLFVWLFFLFVLKKNFKRYLRNSIIRKIYHRD